jgi:hypothetical protein
LGGWDAFLDQLQYFGYLLPALTVIVGRRIGWCSAPAWLSYTMTIVMAAFLGQSGARRILGAIFGMAIILWTLTQRRLTVRYQVAIALLAVSLLGVMQTMLEIRDAGLSESLSQDATEPVFGRSYLHVDDNFLRVSQIIGFIPESYPFVYHKYVVFILIRPIPRVLWPGKPIDPGFDLPAVLAEPGVTASYSSSVIGELYMSAGFFGILLGGWLYGRLAATATQILNQRTFGALILHGVLMMALFLGVRSMIELVLINYVMVAWVGLSFVFQSLRRHTGGGAPVRVEVPTLPLPAERR